MEPDQEGFVSDQEMEGSDRTSENSEMKNSEMEDSEIEDDATDHLALGQYQTI